MTPLDELWIAEAHDRLDAYARGEMEAFSAEEIFEEIESMFANANCDMLNDAFERDADE